MFVGGYWSQRKESNEVVSGRAAGFLAALALQGPEFSTWYSKGWSRKEALRSPLAVDAASISRALTVNRRETDRQPISELGFSLSIWNGSSASFSGTLGGWSQRVGNHVILTLGVQDRHGPDWYRTVLNELVRSFDPDHGVVRREASLTKRRTLHPWDEGMFTYHRGGVIEAHPFD